MIGYISDSPVCDPWSPSSYVIYHNFCKGANFFYNPHYNMPYLFTKWQNFLGPDFFTRTSKAISLFIYIELSLYFSHPKYT